MKIKTLQKLLIALIICLTVSCRHPLDLTFYRGHSDSESIVNADDERIQCIDKRFDKFACLGQADVVKLLNYIDNNCRGGK